MTFKSEEKRMGRRIRRNVGQDFIGWKQGPTLDEQVPDLVDIDLTKEEVEKVYAEVFVKEFNRTLPLGLGMFVKITKQNDTSELDFDVESPFANYLELAELSPFGEEWARALRAGKRVWVPTIVKWIWNSIVWKKSEKYGADLAKKTILLLYPTHYEFTLSLATEDMLRSVFRERRSYFAAVFYVDRLDGRCMSFKTLYPPTKITPPSTYFFKCYDRALLRDSMTLSDGGRKLTIAGVKFGHE